MSVKNNVFQIETYEKQTDGDLFLKILDIKQSSTKTPSITEY
ncbi:MULTISPECIES: hypothetical protein [Emticicia]|nr:MULTISPECIES: hypothetical protein [Emticicia]